MIPNPKLKLLHRVREVMRLKHYSLCTEQCCCDWVAANCKFGWRVVAVIGWIRITGFSPVSRLPGWAGTMYACVESRIACSR